MPFLFWPFIISLLLIITMMILKGYEIRTGKGLVLAYITNKTNHLAHMAKNDIVAVIRMFNRKNAFHWMVVALHGVVVLWNNLILKIKSILLNYSHTRKVIEAVKGRANLSQKSEASPFLKKIEEERNM